MGIHSKIIVEFRQLIRRIIKESFKGLIKMAKNANVKTIEIYRNYCSNLYSMSLKTRISN